MGEVDNHPQAEALEREADCSVMLRPFLWTHHLEKRLNQKVDYLNGNPLYYFPLEGVPFGSQFEGFAWDDNICRSPHTGNTPLIHVKDMINNIIQ